MLALKRGLGEAILVTLEDGRELYFEITQAKKPVVIGIDAPSTIKVDRVPQRPRVVKFPGDDKSYKVEKSSSARMIRLIPVEKIDGEWVTCDKQLPLIREKEILRTSERA